MRALYPLLLLAALAVPASAQIVANSGNWSDPATWSTGAVPTAADDVVITNDSTVTIDIPNAVVRNLTISNGALLRTNRGGPTNLAVGLEVFGNLVISGAGSEFLPLSNTDPDTGAGWGEIYHELRVHGDIDNSTGGAFDMRRGSTSTSPATAAFINLTFVGDQNGTVTLGPYDTNSNQVYKVEIAKTGGARVILGSDVTADNNSQATLTLTSGYLQTNAFKYTVISNNSAVVVGGSPASYVMGELARGFPKGAVTSQYSRVFPIGDEGGYRPVTLYATARSSDDQFMGVRVVSGDADTGSSVLQGGLTDVSPRRYYAAEWYFFDSADPMTVDRVEPTYGTDDGVPEGSAQFVVASSTDERATWTNAGGFDADGTTPHVTTLAAPPTAIQSGDLAGWTFSFRVVGTEVVGDVRYAAVATTGAFVAASGAPSSGAFALRVAPNPAAGRAAVAFTLPAGADVSAGLYDVLGRRVAVLAEGALAAGPHAVSADVRGLAPGVYVVRLQAGVETVTQRVTVVR